MKKLKIELHWQIFIAMTFAVIFGISFPTKYKFTYETFEEFSKEARMMQIPESQINCLEILRDKDPVTETEFFETISYSPIELNAANKELISKHAKYNVPLGYVRFLGDIFMRALKMLIVPLVLSSIISGIANIGSGGKLGKMGLKTILYYLFSTSLAIFGGIIFVNIFKPGIGVDIGLIADVQGLDTVQKPFSDILIQMIPDNIFTAFLNQDMLAIIFFSILFGFFITQTNTKSKQTLTGFFNAFFDVMMKITMFVVSFAPLGVFGLICVIVADRAGDTDKLMNLVNSLGMYSLVVIIGLAVHAFIVLPLLVKIFGNSNPFKVMKATQPALMTAFSTSSSAAALSLTLNCVQERCGVSTKVSGFTLPLGSTVNMDGTALYECVAVYFIAQAYGVDMTIGNQIIVAITALLASIGAAGIPMAGFLMISVILSAVGLEPEAIGLILAVDRILDMFRTSVNVWSDCCGAVIIAKSEGEELKV